MHLAHIPKRTTINTCRVKRALKALYRLCVLREIVSDYKFENDNVKLFQSVHNHGYQDISSGKIAQFVGTTTHEREGKEMGETSYISHTYTCTGYTCLEAEAQCIYMYM